MKLNNDMICPEKPLDGNFPHRTCGTSLHGSYCRYPNPGSFLIAEFMGKETKRERRFAFGCPRCGWLQLGSACIMRIFRIRFDLFELGWAGLVYFQSRVGSFPANLDRLYIIFFSLSKSLFSMSHFPPLVCTP